MFSIAISVCVVIVGIDCNNRKLSSYRQSASISDFHLSHRLYGTVIMIQFIEKQGAEVY